MGDDQTEINTVKVNSPSIISFKKWFLLSTGVLLAAISLPIVLNYSSDKMVSIKLLLNKPLLLSSTIGITYLSSQRLFASTTQTKDDGSWKTAKTIYEFSAKDLEDKEVSMEKYKDHVVIVVNVATYCGLTRANYAQLNDLYNKYKDKGLKIAGFPCNQFGNQEPGCSVDIQEFLKKNNVEWDVYSKIDVNGDGAHPMWKWLQQKKGGFITNGIKWNFSKFLVNKNGEPVKRYAPTDEPKTFEKDIQAELEK